MPSMRSFQMLGTTRSWRGPSAWSMPLRESCFLRAWDLGVFGMRWFGVLENSRVFVQAFWMGGRLLRRFMALMVLGRLITRKQPHPRSQSQASCRTRVKRAGGSDLSQSWHLGCDRALLDPGTGAKILGALAGA